MTADQLDDLAHVTDGSVGEDEEQARMTAPQRLPQDPAQRGQDVGTTHVSPDLLYIFTCSAQAFL